MEGQKSDPPGAVSNQNQEEAESRHRDDQRHPEPRSTGEQTEHGDDGSDGASGEGSQSTGDPKSAG
jgi:hypothetical protein